MGVPRARIRLPAGGDSGQAVTVSGGAPRVLTNSTNDIPALEFAIDDDMLNVSDSASFSVANVDGENTGKFHPGQLVVIEESDPDVIGGDWVPMFKGRVARIRYQSSLETGSVVLVSCMDLGWHLTRCVAVPLTSTTSGTIGQLIQSLVHSTWGFAATTVGGPPSITNGNFLNRGLKQGRLGALRAFIPPPQLQFLPIQVEPGQTPWQVLQQYAVRAGVLLNVGVQGNLILFQPDYQPSAQYNDIHYHSSQDGLRSLNNIIGTPSLELSLDELYTEVQCWSTTVKPTLPQAAAISQNPNAQFVRKSYKPVAADLPPQIPNPVLPFYRLQVVMDAEAINNVMLKNRAVARYQLGVFNSWEYTVELPSHSSNGHFFSSDSMITVSDTVHQVQGSFYVQRVRRSQSLQGGTRSQLTLRIPNLLNPQLQAQVPGAGAVKKTQQKAVP